MTEPLLRLFRVVSAPFAENTYIAHLQGRRDCLVIDPGLDPQSILEELAENDLTPAAILNTHGHGDHIAGNAALLTDPELNLSAAFGVGVVSPPADVLVEHAQTYSAAGFDLDVFEIPGHSPGHVVFVWRGESPVRVFGGDVLFEGSVGRTDFPGGDFGALARGIHRHLFTLPDDTIVLPGHGDPTTVGAEKRSNPFVGAPAGYRG